MQLFPDSYEYKEAASTSYYASLEEGDNVFRLLPNSDPSKPAICPVWKVGVNTPDGGKSVIRTEEEPKKLPANVAYFKNKPEKNHCWLMCVLNRATGSIQILDIKQKQIQGGLKRLMDRKGSPLEYDVVIEKIKGANVSYLVSDMTPAPLTDAEKTLVAGYHLDPFQCLIEGGKVIVDKNSDSYVPEIGGTVAAPAPAPVKTIADNLLESLATNSGPEHVAKLQDWALENVAQFNALAPNSDGASMIAGLIAPYLPATPEPAPVAQMAMPEAPSAPPAAPVAVGAGVGLSDIPF